MSIWVLLLLCVVQGLTEFLPISSSGHLFLIEKLFGINNNILLLNLFLHFATLVAVLIYYRKIIYKIIKKPFQPITFKLLISTSITLVFALIYEYFNLNLFLDNYFGIYFIITGIILIFVYIFKNKSVCVTKKEIDLKDSVVVGVAQGFAVLPGLSRSGSTISILLFRGNDDDVATQYSFLMSIPIIIGGFVFEIVKINNISQLFYNFNFEFYIIAFFVTVATAWISLKLTVSCFKKNRLQYFGIYLIVLGLVVTIMV